MNGLDTNNRNLHFVVVPLMAQGHMIPMADLALLLARRGARVSLITTPVNALRLREFTTHATASNLPLSLIELPFPCASAGLPENCENVDLVPSPHLFPPFFKSLNLLAAPLKSYLLSQPPSPTCIISDQCMPWTMSVSSDLSIPRLVFHGPSCFFLLCTHKLTQHNLYETVRNPRDRFAVPGVPQKIEVTKLTAQRFFDWPEMEDVMRHVNESDSVSDGFILNTFSELERWYIDEYRGAVGKPVWDVGPVSLSHDDDDGGAAARGGKDCGDAVLRWMEGREKGSVLFISFGSIARTSMRQMVEIGCGVEAVGTGFVWAVKEAEESEEVEDWLREFGRRNEGKGIVVKGWVQQMVILGHSSVGGFMTHCGWNSTLEAVAAGVAMITWPHFSDQFLNEKLVVEVVGVGAGVGAEMPVFYQIVGEEEVVVGREKVEEAVRSVMCGGERGEEIRRKATEFGEKARKAMEEGGSSYENLSDLIRCARKLAENNRGHGTLQ